MTSRVWLYQRLSNDATIAAFVADRIYQSTMLTEAPKVKPFLTYRQTSDVGYFRGDDSHMIHRNGFMVFVHNIPGDYMLIDDIAGEVIRLFDNVVDQAEGIVRSDWVETSDDYRDEDMGTVLKYIRLQITYKP